MKHGGSEAAGGRVLPRAVIAVRQQNVTSKTVKRAMTERKPAFLQGKGAKNSAVGDDAKGDHGFQIRQGGQFRR
jgi:hypothetical protein